MENGILIVCDRTVVDKGTSECFETEWISRPMEEGTKAANRRGEQDNEGDTTGLRPLETG